MKNEKFYVAKCQKCNYFVLYKVEILDLNKECCINFDNHKVLKVFNDEQEAKNYLNELRN